MISSSWCIGALAAALALVSPARAAPAPAVAVGYLAKLTGQDLEQIKAAGFDFAEVGLRDLAALSDSDFDALLARVRALKLPVRAAIGFLPPEIMVVGPKVDAAAQQSYLARAFARAERLGLETVVFGSNKSRTFPEGFSRARALDQLADFGRRAGAEARKHKLVIAIEPLGHEDTNTVNTVAEAVALVKAVGHPGFQVAVDYYHLIAGHEQPSAVLAARGHLQHVRIANPAGRAFPLAPGEADYGSFFKVLEQIGYHGAIGVETRTGSLVSDGPRSAKFLRSAAAGLAR